MIWDLNVGVALINVNSNARRVPLGPKQRRPSRVRETPSLAVETHLNSIVRESSLNTRATCYCTGEKSWIVRRWVIIKRHSSSTARFERLNRGSGAQQVAKFTAQNLSPWSQNVKNFLIATWRMIDWSCAFLWEIPAVYSICDPQRKATIFSHADSVENSLIH